MGRKGGNKYIECSWRELVVLPWLAYLLIFIFILAVICLMYVPNVVRVSFAFAFAFSRFSLLSILRHPSFLFSQTTKF